MKRLNVKKVIGSVTAVILIAAVLLCICLWIPPSPKRIFNDSVKSIVELKASSEGLGTGYGTAEFIDNEGTLVTNAHIVTYTQLGKVNTFKNYSIRFASEEEYRKAELLKYDTEKDIAVLKLSEPTASFQAIKLGNSDKLSFGDKVYAVGNGSNYGLSLTQGIISIPKINVEYENKKREVIQCDLTISSGNSGGALLDEKGRMIGITTFRTKDNSGNIIYGLAYCIPINIVMDFVRSK